MSETRDVFSGPEDVFNVMNVKLYPNYMQDKIEGKYHARPHEQVLTVEEIAASAVRRGGSTASYEDLVAHWHVMEREIAYQLCNGNAVRTNLYSAFTRIGGMFDNPHESVVKEDHPILFAFHVAYWLKALAGRVKVNIEGVADSGAYLREFHDVNTDTVNQIASPGGMFTLTGGKIKVENDTGDRPSDTGVFLVSQGSPTVRVGVGKLAVNEAGRLVGTVPAGLPADRLWNVEVRTRYSHGPNPLKEIRIITAEWKLAVAAAQAAPQAAADGSQSESGSQNESGSQS